MTGKQSKSVIVIDGRNIKSDIDELARKIVPELRRVWRKSTPHCDQCNVLVVNNVITHEAGCPIAYRNRHIRKHL